MSLLKTEILSLSPELYFTGEQAFGSTALVNIGTLGTSENAAINGDPSLGSISLTSDGGETSIFQSGNQTSEGWVAPHTASFVIGASDSLTLFAAFTALSVPSRTTIMCGYGQANQFGGGDLRVSPAGVVSTVWSDVAGHVLTITQPPLVADNTRRLASAVRDGVAHTISLYVDGALVLSVPDTTAGISLAQPSARQIVGNTDLLNAGFIGLLGHVFFKKGVVAGIEQAVLFNKFWNGSPPPAPFSAQQILVSAATQSLADLGPILASVRKNY